MPVTDRHTSPAAGAGAGGTNYVQDASYDSGPAVQGYMSTQQPLSTGEGYMSAPAGNGPGYGVQDENSSHNTGYGATGAGTGTSGYKQGKGMLDVSATQAFQRPLQRQMACHTVNKKAFSMCHCYISKLLGHCALQRPAINVCTVFRIRHSAVETQP